MSTAQPVASDKQTSSFVPQNEAAKSIPQEPLVIQKDFVEWIMEMSSEIYNRDKVGYNKRHKKWLTNWLFYDGRQYGFWDEESGVWEDADSSRSNQFYINNHLSWFVDATQKEWARAKTQLMVRPTDDKYESAGAARIATQILTSYQRMLRGAIEHQAEGLTAAMTSVYFRYTYFSLQAGSGMTTVAKTQSKKQSMGPGAYMCPWCESAGGLDELIPAVLQEDSPAHENAESPMEEMAEQITQPQPAAPQGEQRGGGMCPQCYSSDVQQYPPVEMDMDEVTGYDEVPAGDVVTENVDPFEIRVHPKARCGQIPSSPYVARRRTMLRAVLEDVYPWAKVAVGVKDNDQPGIRYQRNLERSAGSVSDRAKWGEDTHRTKEADENDMVVYTQIWLDANMYGRISFKRDTVLKNGMTIPADTPLKELFPTGMYVAMIDDKVVDVRDEDKNEHWVGGVYRLMPGSFWGRGIEDAVWQQRLVNDVYNLMVAYLKHCSSPTVLYNPYFIDGEDLSGQPGEIIPVENAGSDAQLSNYYVQIQPPPIPAQVPAFIEQAKKDMQAQIGAFSPIAGAPDIDVSTATGIKLLRESSVALIAMALAIKAQVDANWGKQVLKLCQDNWVSPRSFPVESEYGKIEIKWFTAADIKGTFEITYQDHSVTPRSEIEQRNDILEAMAAGGVPLGIWNPQLPPELRRLLAERFNIPYNADLYSQSERMAKIRLDDLLNAISNAAMGDPDVEARIDPLSGQNLIVAQALMEVPIDALMDDHDIHMDFYRNWMHSDDGIYAPELIKQAIRQRYQEHFQAKIQMAQMQSMAMMMAQGPQMAAQQAGQGGGQEQGGGGGQQVPASKPPKKDNKVGASANDYM